MTDAPVPVETLLAQREWVRRVARALTRSDADADDLAQDAWVRALERGPRDELAVKRWFRTVMRHAARDEHRDDERRRAREAATARPEAGGMADVVAEAEAHRRVVDAVMALDEPYRSAVLLRWFRELPVAEVAARTGVPLETARTRLRRGLALLRERFDAEHGGDRGAWRAALLPLLGPDPWGPVATTTGGAVGAGAGVGAGAAAGWITGAVLMGTKAKVAVAAALLLLGGGAYLAVQQRGEVGTVAPAPPESPAGETAAETPRPAEAPRTRAAAPAETAPAPERPAERPEGFVVRGRVIDDETGAPVSGAKVAAGSEFARMPGQEPSATTGEDGTFRILDAADGAFGSVIVSARGYAEMVFHLAWKDPRLKAEPGDAGELRLARGSSIAGKVLAADGTTPVPGARILLSRITGMSGACWINFAAEWGRSDERGRFALERVAPLGQSRYTLFAATADGVGWTALPPTAGKSPLDDVVVALRETGAAAVTVRDAAGTARGGVRVTASPRFPPLGPDPFMGECRDAWVMEGSAGEAVFVRQTGADGVARFERLPPGPYEFVAWNEGTHSWTGTLRVETGKETAGEITLRASGAWAVEGVVRSADGVPLAGVDVTSGWGPKPVRTEADGRYRFADLDPQWNEFHFTASREGYAPVFVRVSPDDATKLVREDIVLEVAQTIAGKVVDQTGKPVEGAALTFQRAVPSPLVRSGQSGADGRFSIPDAAAGTWRPGVFPPAPWEVWEVPAELPDIRGGDREVTFVLTRREPGRTRLVADVVDAAGKALAPQEIMLLPAGPLRRGMQTLPHGPIDLSSGKVVIERVRVGSYRLWVRVEDQGAAFADVTVPEGVESVAAKVMVQPTGSVRGRVDVPPGARRPFMVSIVPADGASTPGWAQYQTSDMIGAAKVAADGTFLFEGLVPGRWRFTAETRGAEGSVDVDVPPGGVGEPVLPLLPVGVLSFRLAAPSPSDVVEFEIARGDGEWTTVMRWGGQKGQESRHDANVTPGRIRWRVSFPAMDASDAPDAAKRAEGDVDVAVGEPVVVNVPVVVE